MSGIGGDANTMGDINRPTSRVLAPPGGGSSNIFGGPEPQSQPPARKANPQQQSCNIFGQPIVDHNQVKKSEPKAPTPAAATQAPAAAPTQQTPTNETNGYPWGGLGSIGQVNPKRTSTKVHAPPGGHSSISFG